MTAIRYPRLCLAVALLDAAIAACIWGPGADLVHGLVATPLVCHPSMVCP